MFHQKKVKGAFGHRTSPPQVDSTQKRDAVCHVAVHCGGLRKKNPGPAEFGTLFSFFRVYVAAMLAAVARVVWATESRFSFQDNLEVTPSVCRHSKHLRSTESGTVALRHATSS